jgi:hydrogenase expression/formation protein HypC
LMKGEGLTIGDWVLIHVGFAMTKISDREAVEQLRLLAMLGEDEQAIRELEGYRFE